MGIDFRFDKRTTYARGRKKEQNQVIDLGFLQMDVDGFNFLEQAEAEEEHADPGPVPNPLEWAKLYRRIDGRPFTLERFRPLEQIYLDQHPHIVVMKPAQVGISELAVTRTCWTLDVGAKFWETGKEGLNVAYLFPTQQALIDFSKERFTGLQGETSHLKELFNSYDDVTFKQARDSYLYLRGAWSETALLSFPADVLILDEYDRMDPDAISLAIKRLRGSLVKRRIDISTPTLPGKGIHAQLLLSDHNVWELHCGGCDGWIELDFFKDVFADGQPYDTWVEWEELQIRRAQYETRCPLCHQAVDRFAEGRWTPKTPENIGIRGYHIPWYAFPTVSLTELAVDAISQDPTRIVEFYRSDLGIPYEAEGARITLDMLSMLSAATPQVLPRRGWRNTTMGVDVGSVFNVKITSATEEGILYTRHMGIVRSYAELDRLMAQFQVRRCVIDALPELHATEAWAKRYKGRVVRAYYPNTGNMSGLMFKYDKDTRVINIHRTTAMDAVYDSIAEGTQHWTEGMTRDNQITAQMRAPIRVVTLDDHGQPKAAWVHTSPDHFYHACVYDLIAREILPKTIGGVVAQGSAKGWSPA